MRDRLRHAAPHQELAVLHGDPDADHDQHDGVDGLAPERANEEEFRERTEDEATDDGHTERGEEVQVGQRQGGERRIGAQRVELAVGEVHDVHQPEDERQPDAQQRVRPAEHQAVHQVLKELIHYFRANSGSATLPSRICTMKIEGLLWPLSLPAGPSFSKWMGPLTPVRFTRQSASRTALASSFPAPFTASASVTMPSGPRKPSVRPSNGLPRLAHSSTNALASLPSGMDSGNQGMKKTMWYVPSAAAPACLMSWVGEDEPPVVTIFRLSRCSWACFSTSVICSTAVVRKSVSPPVVLILVICAFMSVALCSMNSVASTGRPFFFKRSPNAWIEPRPQSVLTARKSAFLMASLSTYGSRPTASISLGGLIRKIHGLPRLVMDAALDVSTTMGTPYSSSFGIAASVIELPQAPMMAGTLSRTISFSAALAASLGSDLLSSIRRSTFRPAIPPFALTQSRAISAPMRM